MTKSILFLLFTSLIFFGCKKNDGNKNKQGAEKISVIRNEHEVIIEEDLFKRNIVGGKGWEFVFNVKHNKYH